MGSRSQSKGESERGQRGSLSDVEGGAAREAFMIFAIFLVTYETASILNINVHIKFNMIKSIPFYMLLLMVSGTAYGQSLTASFGPIFTKTNAVVPVVNGKEDFSNTDYSFSISYQHFLKNKKYALGAAYSQYDGCTFIVFEHGGWIAGGGIALAKGFCHGVKLYRFDLSTSCLLTQNGKKFYFKPFAAAGLQLSRTTGIEYWREALQVAGPNYFELEPVSAEPMNTAQVVPSLGFHTGFLFWRRLDLGLSVQGVYAFKPYQKMYLKYHYKGTPQPVAEYESTGTGLFVAFGIGYRLAKGIK